MTTLQRILVPLDGSDLAERALPVAVRLARAGGGQLTLLLVLPDADARAEGGDDGDLVGQAMQAYLEQVAKRLGEERIAITCTVARGDPASTIVEEARSAGAGLVVMGTHGLGGLGRWVYGSVAEAVLRTTPVPVLLLRAWQPDAAVQPVAERPRLLVPLDGSRFAEAALPVARELARGLGATLALVEGYHLPDAFLAVTGEVAPVDVVTLLNEEQSAAKSYLEETAKRLRADGYEVETRVEAGEAADLILQGERDPRTELVVMATHGRGGVMRVVFGSVTDTVVRLGSRPVVVVRPDPAALS